ncbi:hypothetical protein GCK72_002364 [Caenorhabditis remanei]|uniref:Uncharacterized protein n=1 Tax=Caenorhabditis remanei TaxID=31234 RepID=A0A6A5HSJ3_CAERE|nr:hypothetical protein GCK72_002364 [Caenorhabditis remanei]KAF1770545.1 hypothetical protein GCK72_002364 [Caenorhabditis remanei]
MKIIDSVEDRELEEAKISDQEVLKVDECYHVDVAVIEVLVVFESVDAGVDVLHSAFHYDPFGSVEEVEVLVDVVVVPCVPLSFHTSCVVAGVSVEVPVVLAFHLDPVRVVRGWICCISEISLNNWSVNRVQ